MSEASPRTIIKLPTTGPLRVKGPATLVDAHGTSYEITRQSFFLCRCGRSQNKPFCGSHTSAGFAARERAKRPRRDGGVNSRLPSTHRRCGPD